MMLPVPLVKSLVFSGVQGLDLHGQGVAQR